MPGNRYPRTRHCWPPGRTRPTWAAPAGASGGGRDATLPGLRGAGEDRGRDRHRLRQFRHLAAARNAPRLHAHQRLYRAGIPANGTHSVHPSFPAQNQCRLILGRALDVLPRLSDCADHMVFCDADVRDYPDYLTAAPRSSRPGGVVAFENALPTGTQRDDPEVFDGPCSTIPASMTQATSRTRSAETDRLVPILVPLCNRPACRGQKGRLGEVTRR